MHLMFFLPVLGGQLSLYAIIILKAFLVEILNYMMLKFKIIWFMAGERVLPYAWDSELKAPNDKWPSSSFDFHSPMKVIPSKS